MSTAAALKKTTRPKSSSSHPAFIVMITTAIKTLNEPRTGTSKQAICKYICANYYLEEKFVNQHTKNALKAGVKSETLKQTKGVGATGSFKLGEAAKKAEKSKAKKTEKLKVSKIVKVTPTTIKPSVKTVVKKAVTATPKTSAKKAPLKKTPIKKMIKVAVKKTVKK